MTKIEWTDKSINPIRAYHRRTGAVGHYCELFSSGCAHCYASGFQKRFHMPHFPGKPRLEKLPAIDSRGRVIVTDDLEVGLEQHALDTVLKRKKPTMWFWCDMTDMFGSWVPDLWLDKMFAVMNATGHKLPIPANLLVEPWHTHQILTKRIDRAQAYIESRLGKHFMRGGHPLFEAGRGEGGSLRGHGADVMNAGAVLCWPLSNVWLGTSCENQTTFDERFPWLDNTPAAVQFLSLEPLIGPIDVTPFCESYKRRWVIVGGESGLGARICEIEWIRKIVETCQKYGTPVFVKQLGKRVTIDNLDYYTQHPKGGDPEEWPEDLRVRQFPAMAA